MKMKQRITIKASLSVQHTRLLCDHAARLAYIHIFPLFRSKNFFIFYGLHSCVVKDGPDFLDTATLAVKSVNLSPC